MRRIRNGGSAAEVVRHLLPDNADEQYPRLALASGLDEELGTELARLLVNAYEYGRQSTQGSRGAKL
jgi:hypothetical protein